MSNVVSQPTPEILKTTDLIEQGIGRFIQARFTVTLSGKWESDVESMVLLALVIRNMEAILELARKDIVLLPAANVLARAVFEIALKSARMVQPDDPYMRELRWLVHLEEEARLHVGFSAGFSGVFSAGFSATSLGLPPRMLIVQPRLNMLLLGLARPR